MPLRVALALLATMTFVITSCSKVKEAAAIAGSPTVGTAIVATPTSYSRISLTWGAASDDVTAAAQLQYKLVTASSSAAIDTVTEADAITGGSLLLDWTANTLSASVAALTLGTTYYYAVLVKDADSNKSIYTPQSATTFAYYRIYQTAITYSGDMDGIVGADAICTSDSNKPAVGTYKAFLTEGTARVACTTANCGGGAGEHTDWVLLPSTAYARADGTAIGTTTAAGIFTFPLTNSLGTTGTIWTGIATNWTTAANDCGDWNSLVANGTEGLSTATDNTSLSISIFGCGNSNRIYCVEQ